jgi:hypothetical protein
VRISDFTVIAGDAKPNEIAQVLAWAQENQQWLALKWVELNERS